MKIVLIITDYGSFNNFLSELAVALAGNNEVHIISSKENVIKVGDKYNYDQHNIVFHHIDIPRRITLFGQFRSAGQIRKIIDLIRPDIVHSHFTTATFPTLLFRKTKFQYWATIHGLGMNASSGIKKAIFTLVEIFCFFRLDRLYLVNEEDYQLVKKFVPKKVFKTKSFGFGCDIKRFSRAAVSEQQTAELVSELDLQDRLVIAFTGRYVAFKGFDLVYRSFKKLSSNYPGHYKLLLIGGLDPAHTSGLSEKEWLELRNNASIIDIGYTSRVEKYLALANLFLFPSKKEGLPTCVIEALAMGVPVITLNERGNKDVIINEVNGYLLNSATPEQEIDQIVDRIIFLKNNPAILSEMCYNALKQRAKYSRSIFIEEQLAAYQSLNPVKNFI